MQIEIIPGGPVSPYSSPPSIVLRKVTILAEIEGKRTDDCQNESEWSGRESFLRLYLKDFPEMQAPQKACAIATYDINNAFVTPLHIFLRHTLQLGSKLTVQEIASILKKRGNILTLPALESIVKRSASGEDFGLSESGFNLAFLLMRDGGLQVVSVSSSPKSDNKHYLFPFDYFYGNMPLVDHGTRLILRNPHRPT